ncbi:hypothetical protein CDD83_311 [Cordyceps sp. RAO-2017]|nr:hypothetical protein CDD83_311 [Cordyceps sp. RAO-2017]
MGWKRCVFLVLSAAVPALNAMSGAPPPDGADEPPIHGRRSAAAAYDYVVVGGGTAGVTVAVRLAEASFRVALIEAGPYYEISSLAAVPAAAILPASTDPTTKSLIDWGFVVKGHPGTNNRDIHYARGRCLGGSWVAKPGKSLS